MTAGLVHLVQSQNCFRQFNVFGVRTVVFRFMLRLASSVVTHTHTVTAAPRAQCLPKWIPTATLRCTGS